MAAKRNRTKPKQIEHIKDLKAADTALGEIAGIKRRLAEIDQELNDGIDLLKAEAAAKAHPIQERLTGLENGLLAYAEFNQAELFAKKKSVELTFGSLGYRKSTEVKPKPKFTWKLVLEKLKELSFSSAIRTKEEPNKEELRGWPEERLDLVGVRKVPRETFWYETKEEEVAGKAAAA